MSRHTTTDEADFSFGEAVHFSLTEAGELLGLLPAGPVTAAIRENQADALAAVDEWLIGRGYTHLLPATQRRAAGGMKRLQARSRRTERSVA